MEMMPYHPELELGGSTTEWVPLPNWEPLTGVNWKTGLPVLRGLRLTLREVAIEDAPALFAQLTTEEVARFISPPPTSVSGFEKFVRWAHQQRAAGQYACFAVVPAGQTTAVGLFQIRMLGTDGQTAEWGFALGSAYWGTGLFLAGAHAAVNFAFAEIGVRRLEARACVANGRGTAALRKLGAVREAVLHQSFERHGERLDQALWTIACDDWRAATLWEGTVH